ncbi:MAG: RNA methyltransferase substrate-binding domain-containing protein, partial [Anaerolineales bacterium]
MITSTHNPRIKEIRLLNSASKHRKKSGLYAVEGIRLLEEALQAHQRPQLVIYTEDLDQRATRLLDRFESQSIPCEPVTPQVLQSASDTETPQGMLAVLPIAPLALPADPELLLILDAMRDPGNRRGLRRTNARVSDGIRT